MCLKLQHILGEVYKIDEKMLETLDQFEGYPQLYTRRLEAVRSINGRDTVSAWIFVFQNFHDKALNETFHENYVCKNYDFLRSLSEKITPEEKTQFYSELRMRMMDDP